MPKYEIPYVRYVHSLPPGGVGIATFAGTFSFPWPFPLAVRRDYFDQGKDAGLHHNEDFFVLYIVRGGRGAYQVDGHPYAVARGDVYILGPGIRHGFRDYQDVELDMFAFQTSLFTRADLATLRGSAGFWNLFLIGESRGGESRSGESRGRKKAFRPRRLHLSPERYAQVEEMIESIRQDITLPNPLNEALARHRFFCLIGTLANWHSADETPGEGKASASVPAVHTAHLGDVLQYCEKNFDKPLTIAELAARLFLSPDHFSRLFTGETGVPPATYLRRLRLEKAQALLRDTALTTNEIAARAGFAGREQMVRAFRAVFNTTPSEYRGKFRG